MGYPPAIFPTALLFWGSPCLTAHYKEKIEVLIDRQGTKVLQWDRLVGLGYLSWKYRNLIHCGSPNLVINP